MFCLLAIVLAFKWRTSLWRSNRTGPSLSNPSSEQSRRNFSPENLYISEVTKAMQHNNEPTRTLHRNSTAQLIVGVTIVGVPEKNHALLPVDEPSGRLPSRVAILGVVPRNCTISALGPLSRRAPDDGVLWGTVSQPKYSVQQYNCWPHVNLQHKRLNPQRIKNIYIIYHNRRLDIVRNIQSKQKTIQYTST